MNIRQTALTAAVFTAFSSVALAQSDPFILDTLKKQFPENTQATKQYRSRLSDEGIKGASKAVCQLREITAEESQREEGLSDSEGMQFCMRFHSEKIVDGETGKHRYLLFIGDALLEGHSSGGLISLMVFTGDGQNWTLARKEEREAGSWGEAPSEWQWLEFAPQSWGIKGESHFMQMGYVTGNYVLLHDDNQKIRVDYITASAENGASRDCDMEPKKERKACRESLYDLTSTFKLRPDLGAENGAYPIEIQVSGYQGTKKKYKNQSYIFQYDGKTQQYIIPKDYPFEDI